MGMTETTLHVGSWYSRCGQCGGNADPYEHHHLNEDMAGEGCGALFIAISCDYIDFNNCCRTVREMRPDLQWSGYISEEELYA